MLANDSVDVVNLDNFLDSRDRGSAFTYIQSCGTRVAGVGPRMPKSLQTLSRQGLLSPEPWMQNPPGPTVPWIFPVC